MGSVWFWGRARGFLLALLALRNRCRQASSGGTLWDSNHPPSALHGREANVALPPSHLSGPGRSTWGQPGASPSRAASCGGDDPRAQGHGRRRLRDPDELRPSQGAPQHPSPSAPGVEPGTPGGRPQRAGGSGEPRGAESALELGRRAGWRGSPVRDDNTDTGRAAGVPGLTAEAPRERAPARLASPRLPSPRLTCRVRAESEAPAAGRAACLPAGLRRPRLASPRLNDAPRGGRPPPAARPPDAAERSEAGSTAQTGFSCSRPNRRVLPRGRGREGACPLTSRPAPSRPMGERG